MAQDENDVDRPDDEEEAEAEAEPEAEAESAGAEGGPDAVADAETVAQVKPPAAPPAAPRPQPFPAPAPLLEHEEFADDHGTALAEGKRPGRFSRRGLTIFIVAGALLVIAGGAVAFFILYEQHQAGICAEARRTNDPGKLRECWQAGTQEQWRPVVLYRIGMQDQVENIDVLVEALQGDNYLWTKEAANALLYMVQSIEESIRAKVAALKDAVLKKRMNDLKGVEDKEAQETRALLALILSYLEDVDGLEVALTDAAQFGFGAYSSTMFGFLTNREQRYFDAVMKMSETADPVLMVRLLSILESIDYSGRGGAAEARRTRVIALLKKTLSAHPTAEVEVGAIMTWAETGDEGALERVAEYFDRAAVLENAEAVSDRQAGQELALRAEQIFKKVKLRFGAEKLVDLYRLIKRNRHRQERILYLIRELHDPRQKVRDFLLEAVEHYAPTNDDFGLYLDDNDQLTHAGTLYVNAVFSLAELLDERSVGHLKMVLNKFSTMVKITDEQANLYNAGLLILGSIAVHLGGPAEEEIARYIFELSDPDKYPERWTEKRAGKMRVLSFIAADLWRRFLAEHAECRDDIDPLTTVAKLGTNCPTAVDLKPELELAPTPGAEPGAAAAGPEGPPPSAYEELPEMQRRRERLRMFEEGEKPLDETKHEELRWVFDSTSIDVKQKVYYFIKTFACPIEITMVAAMMDRNDPRVKAYERWCGDYGPATESMARLAHFASASFQREARQYLTDRLSKHFLKYPETQEEIQYDQYMNQEIYNFVMYRQAVARSLGYLGLSEPKLLEALKTVVWDETDHPQVGRYAGVSLGIVADAPTLDLIVEDFTSSDVHPDVRGYLLKAIDGHFRFAPLNDLAPPILDAENRAIERLVQWLSTYQGGVVELPASRLYLLGALFGSMANSPQVAEKLASLVKSASEARTREIALLALICCSVRDVAMPVFEQVYKKGAGDASLAPLRSGTTLRTLRDIFTNVGTPNDPYTIPVRSALEIENQVLFHRLDVLHALKQLEQKEFLDYFTMRMALALGVDKDAMDKAVSEAGLEAADRYTPIAYKLAYRDNFTYYETPYLTWIDALYNFAKDGSNPLAFRKYAIELLWRIDERGFVYSIYADTGSEGVSEQDRALHDYVYESVMREFI